MSKATPPRREPTDADIRLLALAMAHTFWLAKLDPLNLERGHKKALDAMVEAAANVEWEGFATRATRLLEAMR